MRRASSRGSPGLILWISEARHVAAEWDGPESCQIAKLRMREGRRAQCGGRSREGGAPGHAMEPEGCVCGRGAGGTDRADGGLMDGPIAWGGGKTRGGAGLCGSSAGNALAPSAQFR
jgi:hypothetical protein